MEAALVLVAAVLLSSSALVASDFCVCRSDQSTAALQKTIDYSCGQGADCTEIQQTGACYNPNDVASHCSWAANSYFQKNRATGATCDFTGVATLSTADPSFSGCTFPSSASAAGTTTATGTTTGTGTSTGTGTGTGTSTGTFSPGMGTGFNGTGTSAGTFSPGMGTGSMDGTAAAADLLPSIKLAASIAALLLSFLALP